VVVAISRAGRRGGPGSPDSQRRRRPRADRARDEGQQDDGDGKAWAAVGQARFPLLRAPAPAALQARMVPGGRSER
jgi:hypothetical protein